MAFKILDLAARLLLALGVGCLLLAGYLSWRTLTFSAGTERVTGEVVSYREILTERTRAIGRAFASGR